MLKKQCAKLCNMVLLLFTVMIGGGCASEVLYRATPEDTRGISPPQARNVLINVALESPCSFYSYEKRTVTVNQKEIKITCGTWPPTSYRFAEYPELTAQLVNDPMGPVNLPSLRALIYTSEDEKQLGGLEGESSTVSMQVTKVKTNKKQQMFYWGGASSHSQASDFVRAWKVWARDGLTFYSAQEAAFEQTAQSYRNATIKPQLPEDAVRFKVKAESAVRQKRFEEASNMYNQALGIAPWWPQGHYNRGLILGEMGSHEEAVAELKRYLTLEPDAPNARAVQLKIYEWDDIGK